MNGRTKHGALVGLLALTVIALGSCTWEPSARPVQPEQLAEGSFEVLGMLDTSRYAGFIHNPDTDPRAGIVDLRTGARCDLPENTFPLSQVLRGPSAGSEAAFFWPAARFADDGKATLAFADERCGVLEVDAAIQDTVYPITLDFDQRQVVVFGDGRGKLSLYDPWSEELTVIATGAGRFWQAQRAQMNGAPVGPQLIWLVESGTLTLRALDGTKVVSRGANVTELAQAAFATLRVAYVDGGALYEAASPDFTPALIDPDACSPLYAGTTLSYFSPCVERQLKRLDLSTGQIEQFEPGVYAEWKQEGFIFERAVDAEGANVLFVTPPNGTRTQVKPTLVSDVQPLDSQRIVGRDAESDFGIWSPTTGFQEVLKSAGRVVGFIDTRTMRLSWVALHDINDGRAKLSYVEQPAFRIETIAEKVAPNSVSVLQIVPVAEPVLVYVRNATITQLSEQNTRYRGSLDARVLSGELESNISSDVTSYALVPDPNVPGLLYSADGPKDKGLWFAAL